MQALTVIGLLVAQSAPRAHAGRNALTGAAALLPGPPGLDSGGHARAPGRRRRHPPASDAERADAAGMHRANRAAWDEAAERYERWLPEAIELIRSGGSNLFPVEEALIGDLRGRCRRAVHLQCAGGRDTLSLWNLGATRWWASTSAADARARRRLSEAVGAPARWILADVIDAPAELDGTADLVYTGRGR